MRSSGQNSRLIQKNTSVAALLTGIYQQRGIDICHLPPISSRLEDLWWGITNLLLEGRMLDGKLDDVTKVVLAHHDSRINQDVAQGDVITPII